VHTDAAGTQIANSKNATVHRILFTLPKLPSFDFTSNDKSSRMQQERVGFIQKSGFTIRFLDWMLVAVPLMLGLLPSIKVLPFRLQRIPYCTKTSLVSKVTPGITLREHFAVEQKV
jgi:hypothetical protein